MATEEVSVSLRVSLLRGQLSRGSDCRMLRPGGKVHWTAYDRRWVARDLMCSEPVGGWYLRPPTYRSCRLPTLIRDPFINSQVGISSVTHNAQEQALYIHIYVFLLPSTRVETKREVVALLQPAGRLAGASNTVSVPQLPVIRRPAGLPQPSNSCLYQHISISAPSARRFISISLRN